MNQTSNLKPVGQKIIFLSTFAACSCLCNTFTAFFMNKRLLSTSSFTYQNWASKRLCYNTLFVILEQFVILERCFLGWLRPKVCCQKNRYYCVNLRATRSWAEPEKTFSRTDHVVLCLFSFTFILEPVYGATLGPSQVRITFQSI